MKHKALEQFRQLWYSIFSNGGMSLLKWERRPNRSALYEEHRAVKKVVDMIRDKLRLQYKATFYEINMNSDRIFGRNL